MFQMNMLFVINISWVAHQRRGYIAMYTINMKPSVTGRINK